MLSSEFFCFLLIFYYTGTNLGLTVANFMANVFVEIMKLGDAMGDIWKKTKSPIGMIF